MTENAIRDIRKLLGFLFPILGTSALVFLRVGFGPRALGLKHLLFGGLALLFVMVSVEPNDVRAAWQARTWDESTVQQCAPDPAAVLYAGFSCAEHLPPARARLAVPFDATPYMRYYLAAFLCVCLGQILFARLREHQGEGGFSYDQGFPVLSFATGGRFPTFGKIVLEPALVFAVSWYCDSVLGRHGTAQFFFITAAYLGLAAYDGWSRARNEALDMEDFRRATGIGEGSMLRAPTRFSAGGFWATVLKTREKSHAAGLRRLRAFAERNRARMLADFSDDSGPQAATSDAVREPPAPAATASAAAPEARPRSAAPDDYTPRR